MLLINFISAEFINKYFYIIILFLSLSHVSLIQHTEDKNLVLKQIKPYLILNPVSKSQ